MTSTKKTTSTDKSEKKVAPVKGVQLNLYAPDGSEAGKVAVPEGIFDVNGSDRLLAQYVRVYLANQRQGTHKTKTRSEVNASTKKIYKQKGTGRARHGAKSAPIFVGGGVAHGIVPQSYTLKLNKKQRQKALYTSLTLKRKDDGIMVVKDVATFSGKTKEIAESLKKWVSDEKKRVLFVYGTKEKDTGFILALRNIKTVESADCHLLNAYETIKAKKVLFTEDGLNEFVQFRGFAQ